MEAFGELSHALHDALNIHDHRFQAPVDYGDFLLQVVSCNGNAVAHQDFI